MSGNSRGFGLRGPGLVFALTGGIAAFTAIHLETTRMGLFDFCYWLVTVIWGN
jgi:hypothetical protein